MVKAFASQFERNEQGWIKFPNDQRIRAELFPKETNLHAAKANVHLIDAIIDYVSEAEQTLLDCMGGTGTLMIAALRGRRVVLVEISPVFTKIIEAGVVKLETIAPGVSGMITVINAPCQLVLPIYANHVIFSPPYAQIMKGKGDKFTREKTTYNFAEYHQHPLNVGSPNEFFYHHLMEGVYKKCYDSLPVGGSMTLILKDHIKDQKRVEITRRAVDDCIKIGFRLQDWFKWETLGSLFTRIYRSREMETVDEEDIVVLRKK